MQPEEAFKILGLNRTATSEEVEQSYLNLAAKRQPDRGGSAEQITVLDEARSVALQSLDPKRVRGRDDARAAQPTVEKQQPNDAPHTRLSIPERLRHLDRWSIVRWASVTLGAGFLGAFANSVSLTATPEVVISHVAPSRTHHDRFLPDPTVSIDPDDDTIRGYYDSDWLRAIREPVSSLSDLVDDVEGNKSRLEIHIRSLQRYESSRRQLEQNLRGNGSPDDFFDLWETNDTFISAAVRGEFRRGEFALPDELPACDEPVFRITERTVPPLGITDLLATGRPRRLFVVSKIGGKFPSFLVPEREGDERLSEYFAKALACFDRDQLRAMIDVAGKQLQARILHEQIQEGTERLLGSLSRWSVSIVLSNSAGRSVSVVPRAELLIDTENTALDVPSVSIPLQHRDEDGNLAPVVVGPSEAKTVLFVSERLVRDDEQWDLLYEMYQNRSRECSVIVDLLPRRAFSSERIETPPHPFGEGGASRDSGIWSRIVRMFALFW